MIDNIPVVRLNKLKSILCTPDGLELLDILKELFYDKISFDPDNSSLTAFNEGHRDMVKFLINVQKDWVITVKERDDE